MAKRRTSAEISADMEVLRAELAELTDKEDWDDDDIERSKEIPTEFEELEISRAEAEKWEQQADAIRSRVLNSPHRESGDGATALAPRPGSPEFLQRNDPFEGNPLTLSRDDVVSRSLSALENERRVRLSSEVREHVEGLIRRSTTPDEGEYQFDGSYIARRLLLTENTAYRSAFQKYTRLGASAVFDPEEQRAVAAFQRHEISRAMSENTTTAGGFGIPVFIDPSIIITSSAADAPMLRLCRIENVTNNLWQGVSSAGMTWSYTTEATEASDNSPTLAQPSVRVHAAKGFLPYSIEVSMDYPDFATEMGRLMNSGYQDLLALKTMVGTGTNEPFGIFNALDASTFDEVVTTTDGSFGGPDIFKVWNALPERYRGTATWVMSVSVQSAIRQFSSTASATSSYFSIDLTGGTFRINDRPVIVTDYAPSFSGAVPGTTGAQNILAVGDWQQTYLWVQRAGMSIEQIPMLFGSGNRFPTGQRGLFAWARNGGNVINNQGARLLQNQ